MIIPAHDEASVIGDLLRRLEQLAGVAEVVVVANGCSDDTVDVARRAAPWATVLDLPEPSKTAALDLGDATARAFPRMYLDADVLLSAEAVRSVLAEVDDVAAAAATPRHDSSRSSWVVRSHYQVWTRLMPPHQPALHGTGAMALSRAGRERFDSWPRVIADDFFLDGLFSPAEKRRCPNAEVTVIAPRRFVDCVRRKARVRIGSQEVVEAGLRTAPPSAARGVPALIRGQPRLAVHLPCHVLVTLSALVLARVRRLRGSQSMWSRDDSRRGAVPHCSTDGQPESHSR